MKIEQKFECAKCGKELDVTKVIATTTTAHIIYFKIKKCTECSDTYDDGYEAGYEVGYRQGSEDESTVKKECGNRIEEK